MNCQKCNHSNRDTRVFCGQCGVKIAFPCPSCHFINAFGEIYCGGCGCLMGAQESAIGNSSSHNNSEISPFSKKSTSLPPAVMEELLMIQKATLTKAGAQEDKKQLSQEEIEKLIYKKGDLESGS